MSTWGELSEEDLADDRDSIEAERATVDDPMIPSPAKPFAVAEEFARRMSAGHRIVNWQNSFYQWGGVCYRFVSDTDMRTRLYRWLSTKMFSKASNSGSMNVPWDPNKKSVAMVLEALAAVTWISSDVTPRSWLDESATQDPGFHGELDLIIPTSAGLLHVGVDRQQAMLPLSDAFFCLSATDLSAPRTGFYHEYLDGIGFDESDKLYYAEKNGAAIANWWPEQVAHMNVGPARSGKGTTNDLTARLVGHGAVAISMGALSAHLERSTLIGATYVSVPEHRESSADLKGAMAFFLRATGGDLLDIGRKNKAAWSGRLHALWSFDTNSPSVFRDPSGAVATRFVGLQFCRSFLGREDEQLKFRFLADAVTAFDEAISGLHRLIAASAFTRALRWQFVGDQLMEATSYERSFLSECCEFADPAELARSVDDRGRGGAIWVTETSVWVCWRSYCEEQNIRPGTRKDFFMRLGAAAAGLGRSDIRVGQLSVAEAKKLGQSGRPRVVRGIRSVG